MVPATPPDVVIGTPFRITLCTNFISLNPSDGGGSRPHPGELLLGLPFRPPFPPGGGTRPLRRFFSLSPQSIGSTFLVGSGVGLDVPDGLSDRGGWFPPPRRFPIGIARILNPPLKIGIGLTGAWSTSSNDERRFLLPVVVRPPALIRGHTRGTPGGFPPTGDLPALLRFLSCRPSFRVPASIPAWLEKLSVVVVPASVFSVVDCPGPAGSGWVGGTVRGGTLFDPTWVACLSGFTTLGGGGPPGTSANFDGRVFAGGEDISVVEGENSVVGTTSTNLFGCPCGVGPPVAGTDPGGGELGGHASCTVGWSTTASGWVDVGFVPTDVADHFSGILLNRSGVPTPNPFLVVGGFAELSIERFVAFAGTGWPRLGSGTGAPNAGVHPDPGGDGGVPWVGQPEEVLTVWAVEFASNGPAAGVGGGSGADPGGGATWVGAGVGAGKTNPVGSNGRPGRETLLRWVV